MSSLRAASGTQGAPAFIARWDLDKTYLRTDFDTVRDLVRTAVERPDQKRTVPGAATLMRELGRSGGEIHILSGSPEQLRSRLAQKLRLDSVRFASLTLKPNLENLLRLRFRALRSQLGYKLPALLRRRAELAHPRRRPEEGGALVPEVLLGDDAEADAFVYSLYADVCAGVVPLASVTMGDAVTMGHPERVPHTPPGDPGRQGAGARPSLAPDGPGRLDEVMRRGGCYEDTIADAVRFAGYVEKGPVVTRILIHLDRQSSPSEFRIYGPRVVPFYNYLQAAFVLHEDGFVPAKSVLRVAQELAFVHNFDSSALARSYLDLARRGHVTGRGVPELAAEYAALAQRRGAGASELGELVRELGRMLPELTAPRAREAEAIDYLAMAEGHNRRRKR